MKITSLDLAVAADVGIKAGVMKPLGELVVLAGPNGSGKSRLLGKVKALLSNRNFRSSTISSWTFALSDHDEKVRNTGRGSLDKPDYVRSTITDRELFALDTEFESGNVLEFVPTGYALRDHRNLSAAQLTAACDQVEQLGIGELEKNALAYVQRVEKRAFSATHPSLAGLVQSQFAIEERARLRSLILDLLGEEPGINVDQEATLFGFEIPAAKLSQGQSILLQIAVALHAQGTKLNGLVLLLDEPECHLHPAAVIDAIVRLRALNKIGQIWIATHSVAILAALPTNSFWFVKNGAVSWAGRQPESVLEGLLGGPHGRERVEEFLRLPAQFASNQFAAECLIAPKATSTTADDPQAAQLRDFCEKQSDSMGGSLRILDFGAGQGRLLSALAERWSGEGPFIDAVDYLAFEPELEARDQLELEVQARYAADGGRRIHSTLDTFEKIDAQSIDVVVMCNVLHEIPPEEWSSIFGAGGILTKLLKPEGYLLVLEDMEMPHGEKAHRFGFVLLQEPHLHLLFARKESDPQITVAVAREGRLEAHAIPGQLLGRTNRDTVTAALEALRKTARRHIKEVRGQEPSSRSGRRHALWTQLLANADLGLETLK